jgi:hypothetical protein
METLILKIINSGLIELENLKHQIVNKEAYSYRKKVSDIKNKIKQDVKIINNEENFEFDYELENEFQSYIPPKIKEKMKLEHQENFAILATHGPSFIDEYSLRPENYLNELLEWVQTWDEEEVNFIIEQLAKNKYVDQEAIDRIKKWNVPQRIITNHWWQKIKEKIEMIPKIREEMSKEKDNLIQSGKFKKIAGIYKSNSVITKDMVGEEKLDEIRRELSELT